VTVDAWAERDTHYLDHCAAVWRALPADVRGTLWVGPHLRAHADRLGLEARIVRQPPATGVPILLAGWPAKGWRAPGRPIALIEHGVGQPYLDVDHCAHPGGRRRDRIGLYLCPNQTVADRNLASYPGALAAVVGAPHLDRWHASRHEIGDLIVVSWHFAAAVCPEAGTAWPHYGPAALEQLAATFGDRLRGHAHPRLLPVIRHFYDAAGIPVLDWFPNVLDQAAVYACDNSSTLFEAASVGIPCVVMNAPWYRRDVHHGLRFWTHVPGPQVEDTDQLVATIRAVLEDPAVALPSGRAAAAEGYVALDGHAAHRAARAVQAWLTTRPEGPS
jgi:hypothetical protein